MSSSRKQILSLVSEDKVCHLRHGTGGQNIPILNVNTNANVTELWSNIEKDSWENSFKVKMAQKEITHLCTGIKRRLLPSFGTPWSSILVVLGFFFGGWDPSAEDCLFFSELAPSSIKEVGTASGGGPYGFSSGSSTSGAMGKYNRAFESSSSSSLFGTGSDKGLEKKRR